MDSNYWERIRKHQINFSTSKQTYGFPKQQRFRSTNKLWCDSFYNIPSLLGNAQKCGIGYSKKMQIANKTQSPPPNFYSVGSDFDLSKKNLSLGKFSLGRDKIKTNSLIPNSNTPPPGNYQIRSNMIKKNGISIHPKLTTLKNSYQFNPGPGHYTSLNTLTKTGKYIVSTVPNPPGTKIKAGKIYDPAKSLLVPGPGAYNTDKQNINRTGLFFNSRHSSSRCRTFSRSTRKDEGLKLRKNLPGPGSYNAFSDFGSKMRK